MGPWHNVAERSRSHRRPPTDFDAEHCLVRTVKCVSGSVDLAVFCEPMFDYGVGEAAWQYDGPGYERARGPAGRRFAGAPPAAQHQPAPRHRGEDACRPGPGWPKATRRSSRCQLVALPPPLSWDDAQERSWRTAEYWRQWITQGEFPDHRWRDLPPAQRADAEGAHLRPYRCAAGGGHHVAAGDSGRASATGTTGTPGSGTRPSRSGGSTPSVSTGRPTTSSASSPTCARDEPNLQMMYGVGGERQLDERVLPHLSGYEGARPVRIGNGAYTPASSTTSGARCWTRSTCTRGLASSCPRALWPVLKRQVEEAIEHWRRARPRHLGGARRAAALHLLAS